MVFRLRREIKLFWKFRLISPPVFTCHHVTYSGHFFFISFLTWQRWKCTKKNSDHSIVLFARFHSWSEPKEMERKSPATMARQYWLGNRSIGNRITITRANYTIIGCTRLQCFNVSNKYLQSYCALSRCGAIWFLNKRMRAPRCHSRMTISKAEWRTETDTENRTWRTSRRRRGKLVGRDARVSQGA